MISYFMYRDLRPRSLYIYTMDNRRERERERESERQNKHNLILSGSRNDDCDVKK